MPIHKKKTYKTKQIEPIYQLIDIQFKVIWAIDFNEINNVMILVSVLLTITHIFMFVNLSLNVKFIMTIYSKSIIRCKLKDDAVYLPLC